MKDKIETEYEVPMTHNEYVLDLTHRLQDAVNHDLYFALTLFETAGEIETDMIESLIGMSNNRRSEPMSEDMKKNFRYLRQTDRHKGQTHEITSNRRRVIRVERRNEL